MLSQNTATPPRRSLTQLSFSRGNSRRQSSSFLGTRQLTSLPAPPLQQQTPELSPFSLFTVSPLAAAAHKSPTLRDIESPGSITTFSSSLEGITAVNSSPDTRLPPPPSPSRPSSQASGSTISRAGSSNTSNTNPQSNRPKPPSQIFGPSRSQHPSLSQESQTSPSSAIPAVVNPPRYISQVKPYMPSYMSPQLQERLTGPSKDKAVHQKRVLPTPGTSVRSGRTFSSQEWREEGSRIGSASSRAGNGGGEDIPEGGIVGSSRQDQSQPSVSFARSPDFFRPASKTTSIDMTVGRLSQTVGVHAQWIKQQETSPRVAIEEAGREAIAQMDQKCEKLIKSIVVEAEMVIQRIEETSRRWKDSSGQLQAAVDTMQGVSDTMQEWLRQVQASQELIIQEAIAALQRTVADQLKRNDEAVEMASQRAIGLLEQRGDDMIKSMTTHAEVMVRRMEEMPKRWKESLPDHRDTVPEAIPAMTQQTQHEQGPSWSQEMDAWMTRFDARFSSEFKTIKDAATAQSQVLNAYIQQNQRARREQGLQLLRSASQTFNNESGNTGGDRLSSANHRSSRSPPVFPQVGRNDLLEQPGPTLALFSQPVVLQGRPRDNSARPGSTRPDDTQDSVTQLALRPVSAPTVTTSLNNSTHPAQAETSSTATTTMTKAKRPYKRKVAPPPTTSTVGEASQPLRTEGGGSTVQALSAPVKGNQVRCPATKAARAQQQTLKSTGGSTGQVPSAAAKGKQVARQEPQPPQATDAITSELPDHASPIGSSSAIIVNAATSFVASSPSLSSAPSNDVPELSRKVAGAERGSLIIIQGLGDPAAVPIVTRARGGRGRPPKNQDNTRSSTSTQNLSLSGGSKRRKMMPTPALGSSLNASSAANSQSTSTAIKAEDIVVLTPRLTRATKMQQRPDSIFLDLDTVRKKVEEAGGSWRF